MNISSQVVDIQIQILLPIFLSMDDSSRWI